MKKYILILTAVVLAVMSCSTDNIENGPSSLDIEIVPRVGHNTRHYQRESDGEIDG